MSLKTRTKSGLSDTRLMSLDLHPVSTLQTKVQNPAAWFPSSVYHSRVIKNHCAAFSCQVRGRTAAQLRGNLVHGVYNRRRHKQCIDMMTYGQSSSPSTGVSLWQLIKAACSSSLFESPSVRSKQNMFTSKTTTHSQNSFRCRNVTLATHGQCRISYEVDYSRYQQVTCDVQYHTKSKAKA